MITLKKKLFDYYNIYWTYLAITLISLVFFYPVLLQNKVPLPVDALVGAHVPWTELKWADYPAGIPIKNQEITDAFSQFYPWRSLVGDFWRSGVAPLWNPYMFSGAPFLASLHSAALYPLNIIYLFFDNINSWTFLIFLQILLSGLFMNAFLLTVGLPSSASLFGSIAFSFSGYMIAWLEFGTGGHAGLWLPLILLSLYKWLSEGKIKYAYLLPILFFPVFTAGDFQVPLYITFAYFFFAIYLILSNKKFKQNTFTNSFYVIIIFTFAALLSSIQLIPTAELFLNSVRLDDPYIKEYFYGIMHWEKIVNFIWPDFFGNVVTRNYWGKFGYHEYLAFAGSISLVLATFSLFLKKSNTEIFFVLLLIISLAFLFPTPLAFLPYKYNFPGLATSSASRIIYLVDFSISVLAAFGLSKLDKTTVNKFLRIILYYLVISFGVGAGLYICLKYMSSESLNESLQIIINIKVALRNMIPSTLILLSICISGLVINYKSFPFPKLKYKMYFGLILCLTISELLTFGWKNKPFVRKDFVFPNTKTTDYLKSISEPFRISGGIPMNLFMPFEIRSAEGYDSIYPKRNSEWFSLVNAGNLKALSGRYGLIHNFSSPLLNYANVKFVVDYKKDLYGAIDMNGGYYSGVSEPRYKDIFDEGRIHIFENVNSLPFAWISNNYKVSKDKTDLIYNILSSDSSKMEIVLEENPNITISNNKIEYSISEVKINKNNISLMTNLNGNALLFLSQSYYPGWRAYIDGKETKVLRSNYIFQAIPLISGKHAINFHFDPISFKIGRLISVVTFVVLLFVYLRYTVITKK